MDDLDDDFIRKLEDNAIGNGVERSTIDDVQNLDSPSKPSVSLHQVELNAVEAKRVLCVTAQRCCYSRFHTNDPLSCGGDCSRRRTAGTGAHRYWISLDRWQILCR